MIKFLINSDLTKPFSLNLLIKISKQKHLFPFYHTISDKPLPHIKYLYHVLNVKQFTKHLEYLLKHYTPIHPDDLIKLSGNKFEQKPSMLLTFDDGLMESKNVIAPILLKYSIPAIFFVNTDFIDNKMLFYRYKASLLVNYFNENRNDYNKFILKEVQKTLRISEFSINAISKQILKIDYHNAKILDKIAELLNLDFSGYLKTNKPYLQNNDIEELLQMGFVIGSHSSNHPMYNKIDIKEQVEQTVNSLNYLKEKYYLKKMYFSFPFTDYGITKDFFKTINSKVENLCFTFGSAGVKNDMIENHIQRIPMEFGDFSAKQIIKSELLYYLLKIPFGKNTIKRK